MNSTQKLHLLSAMTVALFASGGLHAQLNPAPEAGLIGRAHAGFDFTYENYNSNGIDYTFGADARVNLPFNNKIDLTLGYDLAHSNGSDHSLNHNALHATVLTYRRSEYGNAYFSGSLGQNWDRLKDFGLVAQNNDGFWGLATGYEIPVGATTAINAGLAYRALFEGRHTTLQYRVEANHWFSSTFAGVASVSYNQIYKAPDSMLYTFGLRWAL